MISFRMEAGLLGAFVWLPRPREERWRCDSAAATAAAAAAAAATDPGALLSPAPCPPPLPSRGQSAVEFPLEGSRILGCPKRAPSTARLLSRGPRALIRLPFSVWTGACYWHGVGWSMFNSSSALARTRQHQRSASANFILHRVLRRMNKWPA